MLGAEDIVVNTQPKIEAASSSAQVSHVESSSRLDNKAPEVSSREESADSVLDEEERHAKMLRMERRRLEAAQLAQEVRVVIVNRPRNAVAIMA